MKVALPNLSLVVLIGASGSGKSTFARRNFGPFEVVSSDFCRGLISNDENDQTVTGKAFDLLHDILHHRLRLGRLTVVDATNIRPEDRKHLVRIAREHHVLPIAIVFDIPEDVCHERNRARNDRHFGAHVIRNQRSTMKRNLRGLKREGFRHIFTFNSVEQVDAAEIVREPLWNDRRTEHGPFDIIGDVHGCFDELIELLGELDYRVDRADDRPDGLLYRVTPPDGRTVVFLGDLVDRGPRIVDTLRLVMAMCGDGVARCVPGNHDIKLLRKLRGRNVQITHGLDRSLAELENETEEFREQVKEFLFGLVSHYVYDDGKLVVAHAGLKEHMQGRGSGKVRDFCLFGETTGETDEYGLPVRHNWAAEYKGVATVVYGHTPVPEPEWLNHTINIDTGCVFGGKLTALRYPERELVSVQARETYAEPAKPFLEQGDQAALSAQHEADDVLDLSDVFGKLIVGTRLQHNVTIREENAAAALEVMSRFAANPKWLIYLPPTMSPSETSNRPDYLEHPDEAFTYYRNQGVPRVVCQQKHMGSRAVVVLCRNEDVARERFGIEGEGFGIVYTRTGRRFFDDAAMEQGLLAVVRTSCDVAGLWDELGTDWVCLDCELMPWSAKAQELLRQQYAAVGAAGSRASEAAVAALEQAQARLGENLPLLADMRSRRDAIGGYIRAYQQYCWPVKSLRDVRLAPFHVLATEGVVHADKDHSWHMEWSRKLADAGDGIVMATSNVMIDLTDERSMAAGVDWWTALTDDGGEGMVVKPMDFIVRAKRGLAQPAVKCRGREYLRIIYGPEYTAPAHMERLRSRGLGRKRSLALREFALGLEALDRFVRREPLRHVHECVFGVLALESEPVDPRL